MKQKNYIYIIHKKGFNERKLLKHLSGSAAYGSRQICLQNCTQLANSDIQKSTHFYCITMLLIFIIYLKSTCLTKFIL